MTLRNVVPPEEPARKALVCVTFAGAAHSSSEYWPVALMAGDPLFHGGAWTADACNKIIRFVDMAQSEAQGAIQALNGFQMSGRALRVNEAQERAPRARQGGGPFRR